MDEDGYPRDAELARIENWPLGSVQPLMEFVRSLWSGYGDMKITEGTDDWHRPEIKVVLVTGGWSGNESIIEALRKSMDRMFWMTNWYQSIRGGYVEFRIPGARWYGKTA